MKMTVMMTMMMILMMKILQSDLNLKLKQVVINDKVCLSMLNKILSQILIPKR